MLHVAWSPIYRYSLPEGHRFPMSKYELLPEQLLYEGTLREENFFQPEAMPVDQILLTHTPEYWQKLRDQQLTTKEIRKIGFPMTPELVTRGRHIAMGTLTCARLAMRHGVAMNTAGGTHHAFADHGEGFCVFNDFALAANVLLRENEVRQILVIDLDVHQGNGTARIFSNDPRVFTFSMHGERNYPVRKESSDLDVGLPDGITDKPYLALLEDHLQRLMDRVQPDLVFYLAGVDVLATDKLGRLGLTREGCRMRDRMVFSICQKNQVPVAVSMGGGYSERLADIIEAHANTFRLAQELYF
ncbi:MAG: histone deacetylase [Lewinellaceae bacterium]|nr:histone deacetylase [Saprospiraceae bacterium]MCB9314474.1 histone deacetylase [Lewinellaceae bacterium]HRW75966.1 histone deacetylase [Saprospiraceae bacterium]